MIVKEALANGRLTARNAGRGFRSKLACSKRSARPLGVTADALALAAVLAQPWVDVVLSGAATIEHLRSNLRAADLRWDDATAAALAPLSERAEEYWNRRARARLELSRTLPSKRAQAEDLRLRPSGRRPLEGSNPIELVR